MKTKIYARESVAFDETIAVADSAGAAVDITGWTFAAALMRQAGAPDIALATVAAGSEGFTVVDGANGSLRMRIEAATLAGIGDTTGNFTLFGDLLGTPPAGEATLMAQLLLKVTTAGEDFEGSTASVVLTAVAAAVRADLDAIAAAAATSAAVALTAAGPNYADTASGLGATSLGDSFAVDNGDGTVGVYRHDSGPVATHLRTNGVIPSVAALVASTAPGRGTGAAWQTPNYTYTEAAAGAADHHLTTAGGVKLYAPAVLQAVLATSGSTVDADTGLAALLNTYDVVDVGQMNLTYRLSSLAIGANKRVKGVATFIAKAGLAAGAVVTLAAGAQAQDFTIDGNAANQTNSVVPIRIDTADDAKIKDVTVTNAKFYGVDVYNSNSAKLIRVKVTNSLDAGIMVRQPSVSGTLTKVLILGCEIDRSGVSGAALTNSGIKVAATNGSTIKRVRIIGCDVVMPVSPSSGQGICIEVFGGSQDVTVSSCNTYGGTMGVSFDTVSGGSVTGCTARTPSLYGYELAGSDHCTINGNAVAGAGVATIGVSVSNSGNANNIVTCNSITGVTSRGVACNAGTGFTCTDNDITVQGASSVGVYILGGSARYLISNNRIVGDGSASTFGVVCESSSDGTVSSNSIRNFITGGVKAAATYSFTNLVITGNRMSSVNSVHFTKDAGGTMSTGCAIYNNWLDGTLADIRGNSTTGFTLNQWDRIAQFSPAADLTATLPASPTKGQWHQIRKRGGTGKITVAPSSGNINGKASIPIINTWDETTFVYNGNEWVTSGDLPNYTFAFSATPDASGDITVTHNLGFAPSFVFIQVTGTTFAHAQVNSITSTTFKIRCLDAAAAAITSGTIAGSWRAFL